MKTLKVDAVKLKRELQYKAERKLVQLPESKQLELLSRKYGHLISHPSKRVRRVNKRHGRRTRVVV